MSTRPGQSDPWTPGAIEEEGRRLDRLRRVIDVACALLRQARVSRAEADEIATHARREALLLFPDKADVFDLVLAPRLRRIIDERWPLVARRSLPSPGAGGASWH